MKSHRNTTEISSGKYSYSMYQTMHKYFDLARLIQVW